jgi:hypothetical protein
MAFRYESGGRKSLFAGLLAGRIMENYRAILTLCLEVRGDGIHTTSHSRSFDHRLRARAPLTAIANAFRCPTSTTKRLPRVTPV